ncbi:MAG: hypothetical protein ACR5KV_07850 [Wolbachia sp.]
MTYQLGGNSKAQINELICKCECISNKMVVVPTWRPAANESSLDHK